MTTFSMEVSCREGDEGLSCAEAAKHAAAANVDKRLRRILFGLLEIKRNKALVGVMVKIKRKPRIRMSLR